MAVYQLDKNETSQKNNSSSFYVGTYTNKVMFKTALMPGCLILFFRMSLTASAELAPGQ